MSNYDYAHLKPKAQTWVENNSNIKALKGTSMIGKERIDIPRRLNNVRNTDQLAWTLCTPIAGTIQLVGDLYEGKSVKDALKAVGNTIKEVHNENIDDLKDISNCIKMPGFTWPLDTIVAIDALIHGNNDNSDKK